MAKDTGITRFAEWVHSCTFIFCKANFEMSRPVGFFLFSCNSSSSVYVFNFISFYYFFAVAVISFLFVFFFFIISSYYYLYLC